MKVSVYQTFDGRGRILGSTPVRRLPHSITMILQYCLFFDSGHAFTETREKPDWMKDAPGIPAKDPGGPGRRMII